MGKFSISNLTRAMNPSEIVKDPIGSLKTSVDPINVFGQDQMQQMQPQNMMQMLPMLFGGQQQGGFGDGDWMSQMFGQQGQQQGGYSPGYSGSSPYGDLGAGMSNLSGSFGGR